MQIDLRRRLTPSATLVGEVADQFLVLGIDTDDRIACLQELLSHTTNVVKLAVAVGMHSARQALAVGDQAKAQLAQAADRLWCDRSCVPVRAAEMQSCASLVSPISVHLSLNQRCRR